MSAWREAVAHLRIPRAHSVLSTRALQDIVTTGDEGHTFLKFDSGMTELLRPSLYGAQHPIVLVQQEEKAEVSIPAQSFVRAFV